ncbi:MAG: 50S ribosomal protein L11 methyltransferase [Alphaproteobacteria bacterium]|nr:MAG: 50S ribosomal protein L11 methyltransferase [Alphaproteobacteria bacterium]
MYQLSIKLDQQHAFIAEEILADMALAVTWFEEPGQQTASAEEFAQRWQLDAIFAAKPDLNTIKKMLRGVGCKWRSINLKKMPQTDWLKKNQESFAPIRAGRFYVHPSDKPKLPPSIQPIVIDAATAFGTGQHSSTWGCLIVIDRLARTHKFSNICDMGCGTAILAMAAARIFPWARNLAVDIDPEAARVAKINLRCNKLHGRIQAGVSKGFKPAIARNRGQYDLVLANILAKPLSLMARDMRGTVKKGGFVVLSGLLANQEPKVAMAYRQQSMRFCGRITRDGWHTLVFQA